MLKLHKRVLESKKRYYMPINCQLAYQPIVTRIDPLNSDTAVKSKATAINLFTLDMDNFYAVINTLFLTSTCKYYLTFYLQ